MTASRSTAYRPILLTKDGELGAVGTLEPQALERFAPIFAVHPATGRKTAEEHLDDVVRKVAASVRARSSLWTRRSSTRITSPARIL